MENSSASALMEYRKYLSSTAVFPVQTLPKYAKHQWFLTESSLFHQPHPGLFPIESNPIANLLFVTFRQCLCISSVPDLPDRLIAVLLKIFLFCEPFEFKKQTPAVWFIPEPQIKPSQTILIIGIRLIPTRCQKTIDCAMITRSAVSYCSLRNISASAERTFSSFSRNAYFLQRSAMTDFSILNAESKSSPSTSLKERDSTGY